MFARRMFDRPELFWRAPFAEMERMRRDMDLLTKTFFGQPGSRWMGTNVFPLVNLTEDKEHYYARAELPGVRSEDLDIQITGRNLSLSGERKIPAEGNNVRYHRRERDAGRFSKMIALPGEINAEKINATITNGVLTVTIPKAEAAKPKQITVK